MQNAVMGAYLDLLLPDVDGQLAQEYCASRLGGRLSLDTSSTVLRHYVPSPGWCGGACLVPQQLSFRPVKSV